MFDSLKKLLKWGSLKNSESQRSQQTYHILAILKGFLEDIIFWKRIWLSLSFILFVNVLFFVCLNKQINVLEVALYLCLSFVTIDAFEAWLKYKHRTTCLKRLAGHDGEKLNTVMTLVNGWLHKKWIEFMYLRETNHTKAFILVNMVFGVLLIVGKCVGGYLLSYILCMTLCTFHEVAPPVIRIAKKIQQNAESDIDFEGLIPEVTESDIKLLSIEPERNQFDERQSLDYWKPDDLPIEDVSDSSENSSSLVTNLSMEKMQTFDKDVDTTDSSDDEYIPIVSEHKDKLQSTVEVLEPTTSWSSSAYSALWNITGAMTNMIYTKKDDNKRNRVASADSSDGFEIIDKHDLM